MKRRKEIPLMITARHFEITEPLRKYIEKKVRKLMKYLNHIMGIHIILIEKKYLRIAEITIQADGTTFYGSHKSDDMPTSINKVIKKMEIQLRKYKEKLISHPHAESKQSIMMEIMTSESSSENQFLEGYFPIPGISPESESPENHFKD